MTWKEGAHACEPWISGYLPCHAIREHAHAYKIIYSLKEKSSWLCQIARLKVQRITGKSKVFSKNVQTVVASQHSEVLDTWCILHHTWNRFLRNDNDNFTVMCYDDVVYKKCISLCTQAVCIYMSDNINPTELARKERWEVSVIGHFQYILD